MKRTEKFPETKSFRYFNANPKGRYTDDCVIRAISTALDRPYTEVYKELFEVSLRTGYMVNSKECYSRYLEEQGWEKQTQPRHLNGTKYTGKEFANSLETRPEVNGDRVIAHIGGHHIVCYKEVYDESRGRSVWKVHDTWDSTDGCIGNYWTMRPAVRKGTRDGKNKSRRD